MFISSDISGETFELENHPDLPLKSKVKLLKTGFFDSITKEIHHSVNDKVFTFKDLYKMSKEKSGLGFSKLEI